MKLPVHRPQVVDRDLGVDLGRFQRVVPQHLLQLADGGAVPEHMRGASMAEAVGVFVLNPKDARHYAKAVGLRGKTDRVDASSSPE